MSAFCSRFIIQTKSKITKAAVIAQRKGVWKRYMNLVNVTEDLTTSVLTSGLLVVDDAGRGGKNDLTE